MVADDQAKQQYQDPWSSADTRIIHVLRNTVAGI
jgi:hypothetical protein